MRSVESMIGFDTSTFNNKKQHTPVEFFSSDDATKMFVEAVESLDTINICNMLNERNYNAKRNLITKLDMFSETYLKNKPYEKHSTESFLNNCLQSMEEGADTTVGGGGAFIAGWRTGKLITTPIDFVKSAKEFGLKNTTKATVNNLGSMLIRMGLGTIIQHCISCGSFNYGEDILKSDKCLNIIERFKIKKGKENMCPLQDIKKSSDIIRTKAGFLSWLLTGDVSGVNIRNFNPSMIAMKNINGVSVVVCKLLPFFNSLDLKQLAGYGVIIVTAIYKNKFGKIKSKNIARGYLLPHGVMNREDYTETFEHLMDNYMFGEEDLADDWYVGKMGGSCSTEGVKDALTKVKTLDEIPKDENWNETKVEIMDWYKKNKLSVCSRQDLIDYCKKHTKLENMANFYKYSAHVMIENISFIFHPSYSSPRSKLIPVVNLISMPVSAIINSAKKQYTGYIFAVGKDEDGNVYFKAPAAYTLALPKKETKENAFRDVK